VTDGGGTLSQDLDGVFATDAELAAATDDDITGAVLDAPTNILTISEGTTDVTVDLSDLDDSAGVSANAANIATNTSDIATNATSITTNAIDIATNTSDIATNTSNISTNATNIATNTSDIATNTSDIATNATNIATNTSDIATNASDIAAHIAADADTNVGNEYNTAVGLSGTSITVTDGGGTLSQDLDGVFATDAELAAVSDDDVSVTNTVAGNRIATISEPGIAAVDINETVTTLTTADSVTYTYTSEDGTTTAFDGTDDQAASEVNSDTPIDVDGDGVTEATVEDVIQAIAPITAKAARIFYPPSIAIDASTNGTGFTVNLYSQYIAQYGTPAVASAGAPAAVPTYNATDLYYYVTYADPSVFANMSIDASGVLTYDIVGQPADYNALINVVFVVK
jgi:hypothetical protein